MYVGMNEISRNLTKANASNKRMYEVCSMEEGAVSKYLIAKNIGRDDNFTFLGMAAITCHDEVKLFRYARMNRVRSLFSGNTTTYFILLLLSLFVQITSART